MALGDHWFPGVSGSLSIFSRAVVRTNTGPYTCFVVNKILFFSPVAIALPSRMKSTGKSIKTRIIGLRYFGLMNKSSNGEFRLYFLFFWNPSEYLAGMG